MDYFRKFMCLGPQQRFSKPDRLSNVPDLVMVKILENCDFKAIQCLRKTCKTFRNFIDTSKPDLKIFRITITAEKELLTLLFVAKSQFRFEYRISKKMDYCSSFFKDLLYLLDNQKSRIYNFTINLQFESKSESFEFTKKLEAVLASRLRPLPVKFLRITVFDEDDVISILKNLKLKDLHILNAKNEVGNLNLSPISKMEQWKKLKEFEVRGFLGAEPIGIFCHLERIDIQMREMQMENVEIVKETFLSSPTPKLYRIGFNTFPNRNQIHLHLGFSENHQWFFPIGQGGGVQISLNAFSINFNRIPELKIGIETFRNLRELE